jgi:hypothetical protein
MDASKVFSVVRSVNIRRFVFASIALIVLGGIASFSTVPYLRAFLAQPTELAQIEVLRITTADVPKYFVTITGDDVGDTGYYYEYKLFEVITTEKNHYGALRINNNFLLTEIPGEVDMNARTLTGHLVEIPDDVQREVLNALYLEEPGLRGTFLPVMLSTVNTSWIGGTLLMGLLLLVALAYLVSSILRLFNPRRDPIMQRLAVYGDPEAAVDEATSDIRINGKEMNKMHFGRQWLVYASGTEFHAVKLSDIMWAYKHTLQNKTYGVTTSKNHSIILQTRHGSTITIPAKEQQVHDWLQMINMVSPRTVIGYSDELAALWNKQRDAFIQQVDARGA